MSHLPDQELGQGPAAGGAAAPAAGDRGTQPAHGVWLGGLAVLVGLVVIAYSATLPRLGGGAPGPGLFPALTGAGMLLAGVALVVRELRSLHVRPTMPADQGAPDPADTDPSGVTGAGWLRIAVISALIVVYVLAVESVGFLLTMAVITGAVVRTLGGSWTRSLLTGLLTATVLYLFFERLLLVQLADGVFG